MLSTLGKNLNPALFGSGRLMSYPEADGTIYPLLLQLKENFVILSSFSLTHDTLSTVPCDMQEALKLNIP